MNQHYNNEVSIQIIGFNAQQEKAKFIAKNFLSSFQCALYIFWTDHKNFLTILLKNTICTLQ